MRRAGFWIFIDSIVFALLPLASMLVAGGVASLGNCILDEASTHACVMLGIDWGGLLGFMAMAGWFVFFTVPIGGIAALLGLVLYVIGRLRS